MMSKRLSVFGSPLMKTEDANSREVSQTDRGNAEGPLIDLP